MIYQYKYKFYLNAQHYILIDNKKGEPHSHCFEIVVDIASTQISKFTSFNEIEKLFEEILNPYQNKLLNTIKPFDELNPTIENICQYFKDSFDNVLQSIGWFLMVIEISETPSRSYIINVIEEKTTIVSN